MTEQEINEAVARKLGWDYRQHHWVDPKRFIETKHVPDYCHSIAAAWEILDHRNLFFLGKCLSGEYKADLGYGEVVAPTPAMALCLAFLKLKEAMP